MELQKCKFRFTDICKNVSKNISKVLSRSVRFVNFIPYNFVFSFREILLIVASDLFTL